jgi:hypothetical protein
MWRISAVSAYTWCLLLGPSALIAVIAALRRASVWIFALSFSLTAVAVGAAEDYYMNFVVGPPDPKFRSAPGAAFELDLFGDAIITLLGVLLFGGSLALLTRKSFRSIGSGLYISAIFGSLYATMPLLLFVVARNYPVALYWAWAVVSPIIAVRLTLRRVR